MAVEPPRPGTDRHLRHWKFVIVARPKDGVPLWRDALTGKVLSEPLAHRRAAEREAHARASR